METVERTRKQIPQEEERLGNGILHTKKLDGLQCSSIIRGSHYTQQGLFSTYIKFIQLLHFQTLDQAAYMLCNTITRRCKYIPVFSFPQSSGLTRRNRTTKLEPRKIEIYRSKNHSKERDKDSSCEKSKSIPLSPIRSSFMR